jgi:hypothetical protein
MLDQLLCIPSSLLMHPEYQQGWEYGGEWFDEEYNDKKLTEDTIRQFLEGVFSEYARRGNVHFARSLRLPVPSIIYTIGFAACWLDKALASMSRSNQ